MGTIDNPLVVKENVVAAVAERNRLRTLTSTSSLQLNVLLL